MIIKCIKIEKKIWRVSKWPTPTLTHACNTGRLFAFIYPPHTLTIRKRFNRARSIACESLVCEESNVYDFIACRAIASDQDSLDRNNKSLVCSLNGPMESRSIIWID